MKTEEVTHAHTSEAIEKKREEKESRERERKLRHGQLIYRAEARARAIDAILRMREPFVK